MPATPRVPIRSLARIVAATACLAVLAAAWPTLAQPGELKLERVMLSTGGVGYFEYAAEVEGNAELKLKVALDQVDDVLKSIVVYDADGAVGQVRLPGREPLAQVFRDLPFGRAALNSPAALLNHLQGAEIRATGDRQLAGRVLKVVPETTVLANGLGTTVRHRVSLMTGAGMQQFILEQAEAVEFVDPELRAQVRQALGAIAAHRVRDSRTLTIVAEGTARRTVVVGYVIAVPLWKVSYRLGLPAVDQAGSARLRGWAHVDNLSGRDWRDVELTLVSGNPVTFRQALYTAYFVDRPEVPVEVLGRVMPRLDQGVVATGKKAARRGGGQAKQDDFRRQQGLAKARVARSRGDVVASMEAAPSDLMVSGARLVLEEEAPAGRPAAPAAMIAAAANEATTHVVFRLPRPVTVGNGQSLMVPIADRTMPGERLALYQPATHARHPLATVQLVNDSETGLPPGSLTLYEIPEAGGATYLGDARLAVLPAGDRRLVSFAVDQKVRIDRESKGKQRVLKGRINRGILEISLSDEQTTLYRIKAPAREPRPVLIEHPVRPGWQLVTPKPAEVDLTERHYRIRRDLAAGAEVTIAVTLRRPRLQTIQLTSLTNQQLVAYTRTDALDPKLRRALARIGDLRQTVAEHERRVARLAHSRKKLFEEQQRIRNNLGRVPHNSDLQRRYLRKLDLQEDELEALDAETERAHRELDAARDALTGYIAGLDL